MIETASSKIVKATIADNLGPCTPDNIYDIIVWCRDYEQRNKFPLNIKDRFLIGFYQIYQGMSWKDNGINKYEGYAAACIHFFMTAERLKVEVDSELKIKLSDFPHDILHCREVLKHLSSSAQQIIYGAKEYNTNRKSRFDKQKLTNELGKAIYYLIVAIPEEFREGAFEKASEIMTRGLKK